MILAAGEDGLSLFQKSLASFDRVRAVEALVRECHRIDAWMPDTHRCIDGGLGGADRQWGVRRDILGKGENNVFQLAVRHHTLQHADAQGFLGSDAAGGVEQVLGRRRANRRCDQLHGAGRIADAETCGGDAEDGVVGCNPQVAGEGEPEPAAEAEAPDHGDHGLGGMGQRPEGRFVDGLIAPPTLGIGTNGRELADIGPRCKGIAARTPQDDDMNLGVAIQRRDDAWQGLPHAEIKGIVLRRIVDREGRDCAVHRDGELGVEG